MKRKMLNEKYSRMIQRVLWTGCVIFLSACGEKEKSAENDMVTGISVVEEEQARQESEQGDAEGLAKTEASDGWEESEQMQDAADGDETIVFESENSFEPDGRYECGGNSRGYYNLRKIEYGGKDALEVSEYLYGEGRIAHGLGLAKFLIVWDQDGEGRIVKWWIEPW